MSVASHAGTRTQSVSDKIVSRDEKCTTKYVLRTHDYTLLVATS